MYVFGIEHATLNSIVHLRQGGELYRIASDRGDRLSRKRLARLFFEKLHCGLMESRGEVLKQLKQAMDENDPESIRLYAMYRHHVSGSGFWDETTRRLLFEACSKGDAWAQYICACYSIDFDKAEACCGDAVADLSEYLALQRQASTLGCLGATAMLGRQLAMMGDCVSGYQLLLEATNAGCVFGMIVLVACDGWTGYQLAGSIDDWMEFGRYAMERVWRFRDLEAASWLSDVFWNGRYVLPKDGVTAIRMKRLSMPTGPNPVETAQVFDEGLWSPIANWQLVNLFMGLEDACSLPRRIFQAEHLAFTWSHASDAPALVFETVFFAHPCFVVVGSR